MNPYPPRPGAPLPYPPYGHPPFNQPPGMGMPPFGMPNMQMHHHGGMPGPMPGGHMHGGPMHGGPMPMGMPMPMPMGMPMGMPMQMQMPFPPFMPGPSGYQPGLSAPGPKVIQGAPVLHSAPSAQTSSEPPMTTIARQQQIYNSHNGGTAGNSALSITLLSSTDETVSIADKVAIACNLLNSHIFTNLSAGLPLTLYIGNVPPEVEDAKLTKVFECFGRVTKWTRPVDPVNLIPRGFGFVTFLQGICGYRCFQVLHNFLYDTEEGLAFQVKLGSKEKFAVSQIEQTQVEAKKLFPEDCTVTIEDIHDFMRDSVTKVFNPPPPAVTATTTATTTTAPTSSTTETSTAPSTVTKPEPPKILGDDGGYYDELENEDGMGEKLQSEIEKFRLRQKQRDLELEEQRRIKIKSKIKQLNDAKLQSERNPPAPPLPPNGDPSAGDGASGGRTAEETSSGRKRGKPVDNQDDIDAKRRRKLEVLQMLSDDAEISALAVESVVASSAPSQPAAPAAPAPLKLLSFAASGSTAAKAIKRNIGEEDEDESKPKREFIPLDFGDDSAGQGASSSVDPMLQRQLQQIEDDEDDEDLDAKDGGAFKKNMNKKKNLQQMTAAAASMIPDSVQAKVLAQAQAISAALASGKLPSSAPVEQPAPVLDKKDQLKKLVDNIPTNREELFTYSIDWAAVDANDIVQTVMRPWIVKKIIEYLGEEEESLTNFMVTNLQNHCQPQDLLEELSMVLDEDSEQFVLKLWRMLIYQSLRVAMK